MELGILMAPSATVTDALSAAKKCMEQLAPDNLWFADRLLSDDYSKLKTYLGDSTEIPPSEFLDPFIAIATMAGTLSKRPQFGIAVTDFIRRAPADLVRMCFTLNQITGSPLNIGFGAGEAVNLLPLDYPHGPKPVSFMEDRLRQFKMLNDEGRYISSRGKETKLGYNGFKSALWVGGQRDRMLRITASFADGWLPAWKMTPQEYAEKAATISQLANEYQRRKPTFAMFAMCVVGPSKAELYKYFQSNPLLKAAILQAPGDVWKKWGVAHPAGLDSKGFYDVLVSDIDPAKLYKALHEAPVEMISEVIFLGNTREILDDLHAYKKAGVEQMVLMLPFFANDQVVYGVPDFYAEFREICQTIKQW